jgi:hypothetical protein
MPGQQLRFEQWANFCVIISAAAATLLGLLFVVITLAAERGRKYTAKIRIHLIRIYLTPAVIYFSSVLLMSALLTVPSQTQFTAVFASASKASPAWFTPGPWQSGVVLAVHFTNNVPTFSPMSSSRSPHTPLWSVVACCCFEGRKSALTW